MPDDIDLLLRRVIGGDPDATREVTTRAAASTSPALLVVAAVVTSDADVLARARALATRSRDRQLVALAEAYARGDAELLDVLVRDHLSDHPDNLVAAWIAGREPVTTPHPKENPPC